MNGLDKIIDRIAADAQAQANAILTQAQAQAGDILAQAETEAQAEKARILADAQAEADENARRARSMAQLEGRKRILGAKQEMIVRAFDKALLDLIQQPKEQQVELLAQLAAQAAVTGRESVLFNREDQKAIGAQVVAKANEILAKRAAPKLPQELAGSAAGTVLDKVVTAGAALLSGAGMLTLAKETRPICGGFILESGGVEINCAYETLVRLSRAQLERETADILFGA